MFRNITHLIDPDLPCIGRMALFPYSVKMYLQAECFVPKPVRTYDLTLKVVSEVVVEVVEQHGDRKEVFHHKDEVLWEKDGESTNVYEKHSPVNDVSRLQALVDKKKVIITEATIRDALRLDDAEGIDYLPNEEIFIELARIGLVRNVDSLTKFYMYPRFLQLMIKKQVGDLSSHTTKYSSPDLTQKVFANMRGVGKGCSGVETPLFEGMLVAQQVGEGAAEVNVEDVSTAGVAAEGAASAADDDFLLLVIKLERRNKLKASKLRRLKKVGTAQKVETSDDTVMDDVSKQGRIIVDMDADKDVTLKDVAIAAKDVQDAEIEESSDVQERQVESQAQIYQINLEHADKGVVIRDPEEAATPSIIIHTDAKSKDKGKGILVEEPKPLKKQAQIKQDEVYARELKAELNKNIDWDEVIDHV
nr:hypothetical protein [Tanacetum cinerariifolium]